MQRKFCEKVDTFAPNVREKIKKTFFGKKLLKLFLQTVESSFDHTVEIFLTKPEKFLLNVQKWSSKHFYSEKKNLFSPKRFLWTRGNFFDKIGKFLAHCRKTWAKHFFHKKKFFWWKISSGHVHCSSDNPVKKLRQRDKKLALDVRKRSETI